MARGGRTTAPGFAQIRDQDLTTGSFRPVYVMDGPDQLRLEQVVDAICQRTLDPASAAFNDHTLQGDQVGWEGVLQQAQGFPMLGGRQLVVVRHADTIKARSQGTRGKDPAEEALTAYIKNPLESTLLVITGEKFDGRKGWMAAAKKAGFYFHFAPPTGRDLDQWIAKAASRAKLDLAPASRSILAQLVGNDLQGLLVEIEKLSLLQESRGGAPSADEIPELVMDQAELEVFNLTDSFGPGEAAALMRSWLRLTTWGTDVYQLTPLLMTHLRRTALAAVCAAEGESADAVADATHLNAWMLKNRIIPLANRMGLAGCRRMLAACLSCEQAQKRRPVPPELAFEQLLLTAVRPD
jgi:DNA polymerase-3 subunit delta